MSSVGFLPFELGQAGAGFPLSPLRDSRSDLAGKYAGRGLRPCSKNPVQSPARATRVLSVNILFWKILVT
jgi:hypothetical protein